MLPKFLSSKPSQFVLIGAWNTVFGYLLFALLYALCLHWHLHYLVAMISSQIISVAQAYYLYKRFVFKTPHYAWMEFIRFCSVYAGQFIVNLLGLPLVISLLHWNPLVAQAVIVPLIVISSYLAHNRISFRSHSRTRGESTLKIYG